MTYSVTYYLTKIIHIYEYEYTILITFPSITIASKTRRITQALNYVLWFISYKIRSI